MCFLSEVIVIKKAIKYNVFQIDCNNFHKGEFYMSLISVNTEALKDIEKRFGTLSQKLGQAESNLKSIRSNLDSDIKNRNGINSKFQSITKELDEEERVLNQAKQFLAKTIKQYQDIEKSMQNKVNEINGDTKTKKNIFSKILDAATSSLRKKTEIIQKVISLPVIIGSNIIGNTVIKGIRDILSKEGNEVTNEPIEEKKEKNDESSIPPLSGILSYNPNVYSEEVLMLQKRLNEIYAGVSGYEKLKEDGYFGSKTLAVVNKYKEGHGLWNFGEYEGKVGDTTWNHMFSLSPVEKVEHNENPTVSQENNESIVVDVPGTGGGISDGDLKFFTGDLTWQGILSSEYEGVCKTIANNSWDVNGGKSYGAWQLSTKQGRLTQFVDWLDKNGYSRLYEVLNKALQEDKNNGRAYNTTFVNSVSKETKPYLNMDNAVSFDTAWRQLASTSYFEFLKAQFDFIKESHYDETLEIFRSKGFDITIFSKNSNALKNCLWSTSVQHGPTGAINIFEKAGITKKKPKDEETIIRSIYEQRMKAFPQDTKRYNKELEECLEMLRVERNGNPIKNDFHIVEGHYNPYIVEQHFNIVLNSKLKYQQNE
jgi:peptidoglycan hydrolase-like protein with peptidoglycan-binding domain